MKGLRERIFRFCKKKIWRVPEGLEGPKALQIIYRILWPIHWSRAMKNKHYIPFATYDVFSHNITMFGNVFTRELFEDWDMEKYMEMQNKAIKWNKLKEGLAEWKMSVDELVKSIDQGSLETHYSVDPAAKEKKTSG